MQTTKTFLGWVKYSKFNENYHIKEYEHISKDLWDMFKFHLTYNQYYTIAKIFYSNEKLHGSSATIFHTHIVSKGIMATFMGNRSLYNDDKVYEFLDMMVGVYNKK